MSGVKLLKASAGSGKTYQLAYEYVKAVISEPMHYRHILAVTFTNKATEEMKRRIISEINDLAQGRNTKYLSQLEEDLEIDIQVIVSRAAMARTKILHDYSHFAILTIDKFFQRIIRSFIKELGVDMNFNLELQTDNLLSSAADALIDDIPTNEKLRRWIAAYIDEKIGEGKKWDVKSGLTALGSEIFGERYKRYSSAAATKENLEKIVSQAIGRAETITKSLQSDAAEALEIIASNGLSIDDFPYKGSGFVGFFIKIAEGRIEPYRKGGTKSRVEEALESDEKWYGKTSPRRDDIIAVIPRLRPLLEKICKEYDTSAPLLNSTELLRRNYRNFALLTDLSQKIEQICSSDSIMPISETNSILNKLISGNDTPFIFEKAGNHFSRFMIDEFQDTSSMQWQNFIPLLHNAISQTENNPVLLVGDVKQSIYRWRGGDWRILAREIESEFGDLTTIDLTTNYRSMCNVVRFNNEIVAQCVRQDNQQLNDMLGEAAQTGYISPATYRRLNDVLASAYTGHEQQAVSDDPKGYVTVTTYGKNADDKHIPPVIPFVEQLQDRGYSAGDIAILVRTNNEGVRIADMLLEHKRLNPGSAYSYDVVTQEALLINSSPAVAFALSCMRLAVSQNYSISLAVYNRWLGRRFDAKPLPDENEFLQKLSLRSPLEAFEKILIRFSLNRNQQNIAYLQAFQEYITDFANSRISDIPLFLKWWDENGGRLSVNVPRSEGAITIITIHKAKGLQYPAVLVPYCDWELSPKTGSIIWTEKSAGQPAADNDSTIFEALGPIPVGFSDKMSNSYFAEDYFDELVLSHVDNINVFYVAVTRAMEELHLMIPAKSSAAKKMGRISSLITESISVSGDKASLGKIEGRFFLAEECATIGFGQPCYKDKAHRNTETNNIIYSRYRSFETHDRLKLRMRSQRYFEEGTDNYSLTARDYGVLMHRVFELSDNSENIAKSVSKMVQDGTLSQEEASELNTTVEKAFGNDLVRSWFDSGWEVVRNENDIIVPGEKSPRRPDRVMIKGSRAVVVDYKFGLNRPASHRRQMLSYMNLLSQMGYTQVDGYIWYVSLNDIEPVGAE